MADYAQLIDESRDYHPSFNPRDIPHKAALRALSRIERNLARVITEMDEDFLSEWLEYTPEDVATAYDDGLGFHLGDHAIVVEAQVVHESGPNSAMPLIVPNQADQYHWRWPTGYLSGGNFYIADHPAHKWNPKTSVRLRVVRVPEVPEVETEEVSLPLIAQDLMVKELALWMAMRVNVMRELPGLPESVNESKSTLMTSIMSMGATSSWQVRDVW